VFSIHVHEEFIKAEVNAENDSDGMMFEHEDKSDSDDLSPSEKALVAAASNKMPHEVKTFKFSKLKTVQNKDDQKRKSKAEDDQDELSAADSALVDAASAHVKVAKASHKKVIKTKAAVKKAATAKEHAFKHAIEVETEHETHHTANKDDLTPEEEALVHAAESRQDSKKSKSVEVEKSMHEDTEVTKPTDAEAIVKPSIKSVPHAHVMASPEHVAPPPEVKKTEKVKKAKPIDMKKAMEKIAKAAAHQAVAEQASTIEESTETEAPVVRPAAPAAPAEPAMPAMPTAVPKVPKKAPVDSARSIIFGTAKPALSAPPVAMPPVEAMPESPEEEELQTKVASIYPPHATAACVRIRREGIRCW
jgi:hypothetical protein